MTDEKLTVLLVLEYPAEVDRLIGVVWPGRLTRRAEPTSTPARQLSQIHTRLVTLGGK